MIRTNFVCKDEGHSNSNHGYQFDDTLSKQFIAYRVVLYAYMDLHKSIEGRVGTTLAELLKLANINTSSHMRRKAGYSILIECLMWFIENEYIEIRHLDKKIQTTDDLLKVKYADGLVITINGIGFYPFAILDNDGIFKNNEPFITITYGEFELLTRNIDDGTLSKFLCYMIVKHEIGWRADFHQIERYPKSKILTKQYLARQVGCSPTVARLYLEFFTDNNLLVRKKVPGDFSGHTHPYIYALNEPGWEDEIKYGIAKFRKEASKQ